MVKWYVGEQQLPLVGLCLQLHGRYGYMRESPSLPRLFRFSMSWFRRTIEGSSR